MAAAPQCLNCGAALASRYCGDCGQSGHVHRTMGSMVHDLLHGVFHFEGKIWRTVPMLVLHPGQLTRRYIAGERARFVSPLALFLFTMFLMFAVYSALVAHDTTQGFVEGWRSVDAATEKQEQNARGAIATLESQRAQAVAAGHDTAGLDRDLTQRRAALQALAGSQPASSKSGKIHVSSRWPWLNRGIEHAKEDPGLAVYKVQSAAYKFSWVLIFLSTPVVALVFAWRREFGFYDHATFVTYSISFMSLFVLVIELLAVVNVPGTLLLGLFAIIAPLHLFAQLRGAYGVTMLGAAWRTCFLLFAAMMLLIVFVVGVIALEVT